jgi:hypothetical protein
MVFTSFSIVTLAVLVAPGFVAVMLAVHIGVIERSISRFHVFIWSIVSSLIINIVFLSFYQTFYQPITGPQELEALLFTPQFQLELVGIYAAITVGLGLLYSVELIFGSRTWLRNLLWSRSEIRRHRRQPWEGALDDANYVRVKTESDARIIGRVREYSRIGKPKQLWLDDVYWVEEGTDELVEDNVSDSIVLLEEDIDRVVILNSRNDTE